MRPRTLMPRRAAVASTHARRSWSRRTPRTVVVVEAITERLLHPFTPSTDRSDRLDDEGGDLSVNAPELVELERPQRPLIG